MKRVNGWLWTIISVVKSKQSLHKGYVSSPQKSVQGLWIIDKNRLVSASDSRPDQIVVVFRSAEEQIIDVNRQTKSWKDDR